MTRLTASELRQAITNPDWRPPAVKGKGGPSTHGALLSAVRVYHSLHGGGAEAARTALNSSLASSDYWKAGTGATMRRNALTCLDTYIDLAACDSRLASAGTKVAYAVGTDEISVEIPVVLRDGDAVEVRLYLDGPLPSPLSEEQRLLYAAPAILACAEEFETEDALFSDWVVGAQVWELRSGLHGSISRAAAEGSLDSLRALMTRFGA